MTPLKSSHRCPGCGWTKVSKGWTVSSLPVVMNYRFRTPREAIRVARRDVSLVECGRCGLIFNATFDPSVIPYDDRYENRQCYSESFMRHLEERSEAVHAALRLPTRTGRVLEVGCGKGDFLKMVCKKTGRSGIGYDTSYEGPSKALLGAVEFHTRYVSSADIKEPLSAILCRHVVEHIGSIGDFLGELARMARAGGDPLVFLETPDFGWIAEQGAFWDVFYEHCNYFSRAALRDLCDRAGFTVIRHNAVFGRQYQWIEMRLRRRQKTPTYKRKSSSLLLTFARCQQRQQSRLQKSVAEQAGPGGWGIWGAGAKGVALCHALKTPPPRAVIDSNPAKQGSFIPGTSIPVIKPGDPAIRKLDLVLIANPNYEREITSTLRQGGFTKTILTA